MVMSPRIEDAVKAPVKQGASAGALYLSGGDDEDWKYEYGV